MARSNRKARPMAPKAGVKKGRYGCGGKLSKS